MGEHDEQWPRGIKVALADDEEILHCVHCERYRDDDPRKHPACLIVKKPAALDERPDGGVGEG